MGLRNKALTGLAIAGWVTLAASAGWAQTPGVGEKDLIRFTRTLSKVAGEKGVAVYLHRARDATGWALRLVDRTANEAVSVAKLPEWVGADYYGYDVTVRGLGNVVVVIFEASPAPGVEAPPAAESYQIAWAYGVRRGERKPVWVQVASTRNSALDGGDRLVMRKDDGKDVLVRLRTSEETRFCGKDLAAYQIFNPDEISFRSRADITGLAQKATELTARQPEDDFKDLKYPRFALWYSATSDRFNEDDSRTVIRPLEIGDGDLATAWVEGARGLGRGEFVTARINDALKIRGLRVAAGNLASAKEYAAFGQPRKMLISLSDGTRFVADIPELSFEDASARGGHVIWFPEPVRSSCVSVVLLDAAEGAKSEDVTEQWKQSAVAISELAPVSELHGLAPEVAALVVVEKLLKADDPRSARRLVQLTSPLAKELVAVLNQVLESGSDEDRVRVVPLLRSLPSESSVPVLVKMFEDADPTDRAYMMVKPAIAAHREIAADRLIEVLQKRPPANERKYTDLTRLIGRLGRPEHLNVLLGHLGDGTVRVRNERVRAISAGGEFMLAPLFKIALDSVDQPAGEDALLALNSIGRKLYFRGQGTNDGSGMLLEVADAANRRRTILLAIRALGFFRTDGAIDLLGDFAATARDPLLRREAIEAVARYPDRAARSILESALQDESPDVRIAGIAGIAGREDRRLSLPQVQRYVERESWTPGLESAYTMLAEFGDDKLLAELTTTIVSDPSSERSIIAADALGRAQRTIPAALAEKIILHPETRLAMRRNLIDLLGIGNEAEAERVLVEIIRGSAPVEGLSPRENERLRQRAVLALGRRDTPSAREVLFAIVSDGGATNDMRAVALRGLAFSQDRNILPRLDLLRANAPNELKDEFSQTMDIVSRRASIEELRAGIDEAGEKGSQEPEPTPQAPPK